MEESFGPILQLSLAAEESVNLGQSVFMLMRISSELSTSIHPALARL